MDKKIFFIVLRPQICDQNRGTPPRNGFNENLVNTKRLSGNLKLRATLNCCRLESVRVHEDNPVFENIQAFRKART